MKSKKIAKVVSVGSLKGFGRKAPILFLDIRFDGERLAIFGVEGPKCNGDAEGGCGQVIGSLDQILSYEPGFNAEVVARLQSIWSRWHLNDMRAGCEHQRDWETGREVTAHPQGLLSKPCEVCGYKYGTEWRTETVPLDVLDFLESLPATTLSYPWRPLEGCGS